MTLEHRSIIVILKNLNLCQEITKTGHILQQTQTNIHQEDSSHQEIVRHSSINYQLHRSGSKLRTQHHLHSQTTQMLDSNLLIWILNRKTNTLEINTFLLTNLFVFFFSWFNSHKIY